MLKLPFLEDLVNRHFNKLPVNTGIRSAVLRGEQGFIVECWAKKGDKLLESTAFFPVKQKGKTVSAELAELAGGWRDNLNASQS